MAVFDVLEAYADRRLGHAVGPLYHALEPVHRSWHHGVLRRAAPRRDEVQRARQQWWGDDPRWFAGGAPPRQYNRVTPLVDGEAFFAALYEALAAATDYVYIIGWCLTPHIPLRRRDGQGPPETCLLAVLTEVARRLPVRILLWSGAPALFQPTTRLTERVRATVEAAGGDIACRLDRSAHFSHCHHQKAIVIDGQVAFVGGMDLTTFQGDRWDVPAHHLRAGPNWHDVQLRIEGEAVADVERNFRQRWRAVTGDADDALPARPPAYDAAWRTPVQIVRTVPRRVYDFAPRGEFGIHHAYSQALRGAQRLIYLENQYLWSPDVMDALLTAIRRRGEQLRIVIVLPARAYSGKYDNDQHVARLRKEDNGRRIVSVYCPYASGPNTGVNAFSYRPTYVHAKVGIVDDEWLTVGSANLNNRGLITDGEMNAVVRDASLARDLRVRLWAEHLALPREQVEDADPFDLTDHAWPDRAAATARIIKEAARPLECAVHRYEVGHMPGSWLLEEAQALTLEH